MSSLACSARWHRRSRRWVKADGAVSQVVGRGLVQRSRHLYEERDRNIVSVLSVGWVLGW